MTNSNILRGRGGGGGGAGFALGPATNTFGVITTTLAAAITLRDDYATANADWLAQYDGNGALMVRLLHSGTIGATYYVRAAGAWAALGPVFQGDKGAGGNAGNDGAPGGGSWEIRGEHAETGTHAASVFVATGIMLGDISDDAIFMYGLGDSPRLVQSCFCLTGLPCSGRMRRQRATHADVSDNAVRIGEITGVISIGGNVYAGYTAAGELLIATTTANQNFAFEIRRHIPVVDTGVVVTPTGAILAVGWSTDSAADAADLTVSSMSHSVVVPAHTGPGYLVVWWADSEGAASSLMFNGGPNQIFFYGAAAALEYSAIAGNGQSLKNTAGWRSSWRGNPCPIILGI